MNLRRFKTALKKRIPLIISVTLITLLISCSITFFITEPLYESNISVLIGNNSSGDEQLNYDQFLLNKNLAQTYGEFAKTKLVVNDVIKELDLNYSTQSIINMISYNSDPLTQFLTLTVTCNDSADATLIAEQLAKSLRKVTADITKIDNLSIIDAATIPVKPININPVTSIILAFAIGIILSVCIVFILEYMDNTVKDELELSESLNLPIIAIIPILDL